jgi:hypothetical protein
VTVKRNSPVKLCPSMGTAHRSTVRISAFFMFSRYSIGIGIPRWATAVLSAPYLNNSISGGFVQSLFSISSGAIEPLEKP